MTRHFLRMAAVLLIITLVIMNWPGKPAVRDRHDVGASASDTVEKAQAMHGNADADPDVDPAVPSGSAPATASLTATGPALDEARFFSGENMKLMAVNELLAGDDFMARMAAFEKANADDEDGRKTFAARDVFIARAAELNSGSYLNGLACGKQLCIGSVGYADAAENQRFMDQLVGRYGETGKTRVSLLAPQADGKNEVRFAISIDSRISRVQVEDADALKMELAAPAEANPDERPPANPGK